jgi:hypothetical protein
MDNLSTLARRHPQGNVWCEAERGGPTARGREGPTPPALFAGPLPQLDRQGPVAGFRSARDERAAARAVEHLDRCVAQRSDDPVVEDDARCSTSGWIGRRRHSPRRAAVSTQRRHAGRRFCQGYAREGEEQTEGKTCCESLGHVDTPSWAPEGGASFPDRCRLSIPRMLEPFLRSAAVRVGDPPAPSTFERSIVDAERI